MFRGVANSNVYSVALPVPAGGRSRCARSPCSRRSSSATCTDVIRKDDAEFVLVTDDTRPRRWESARTMITPIVKEQPLRLAAVERDTFCDPRPPRAEPPAPRR